MKKKAESLVKCKIQEFLLLLHFESNVSQLYANCFKAHINYRQVKPHGGPRKTLLLMSKPRNCPQ